MNDVPTHKKTSKRITATQRRTEVQHLIWYLGTTSPTILQKALRERGIRSARETIRDDVKLLNRQMDHWIFDSGNAVWPQWVKASYERANNFIMRIEEIQEHLFKSAKNNGDTDQEQLTTLLQALKSEDDNMAKKVTSALNTATLKGVAGTYAWLESIKTEKEKYLVELMNHKPLYALTAKLTSEHENNKVPERIPDALPEE